MPKKYELQPGGLFFKQRKLMPDSFIIHHTYKYICLYSHVLQILCLCTSEYCLLISLLTIFKINSDFSIKNPPITIMESFIFFIHDHVLICAFHPTSLSAYFLNELMNDYH